MEISEWQINVQTNHNLRESHAHLQWSNKSIHYTFYMTLYRQVTCTRTHARMHTHTHTHTHSSHTEHVVATDLFSVFVWLSCSSCLAYHSASSFLAWTLSSSRLVSSSASFWDNISACSCFHFLSEENKVMWQVMWSYHHTRGQDHVRTSVMYLLSI